MLSSQPICDNTRSGVSDRRKGEEPGDKIIKDIVDIVYELDKDRKITYLNHRSEQILGYRPTDLLGKSWSSFIMDARILDNYSKQVEKQKELKSSKPFTKIIPFLHANGVIVTIELIEKTEFDDKGKAIRFYGIARDITEETEKNQKKEQAKDIMTRHVLMTLEKTEQNLRNLAMVKLNAGGI